MGAGGSARHERSGPPAQSIKKTGPQYLLTPVITVDSFGNAD